VCSSGSRYREQARKKLWDDYELVAIGELATPSRMLLELDLAATLDGHIDRCLKRLLHIRGIKSLATTSASAMDEIRQHRIITPSDLHFALGRSECGASPSPACHSNPKGVCGGQPPIFFFNGTSSLHPP
jgi:hypothetical protein